MTLYSPPDKSNNNNNRPNGKDNDKDRTDDADYRRFYVRPSIGLKMWGPLVPASDNKAGIWSLIGLQTAIGILCVCRFRGLRRVSNMSKIMKKDIAEIPSLNRFSTSPGSLFIPKILTKGAVSSNIPSGSGTVTNDGAIPSISPVVSIPDSIDNTVTIATGQPKNSTVIFQNLKDQSNDQWNWSFLSSKFTKFKSIIFLLTGTLILAQSGLEISRMCLLKYDPWIEEAKSVRDKKFFNDIVKFYHEGIDPTKIKVKDAASGNTLSNNIPQVKQSVALVRAQSEAENPVFKWFGPIDYQPMSFSEFVDKIEFHLDMTEALASRRRLSVISTSLKSQIVHSKKELERIITRNSENRVQSIDRAIGNIQNMGNSTPKQGLIPRRDQGLPLRGIIMEAEHGSPEEFDLTEIWTLYNPWMNLALDTSLSIKFLPTVMNQTEMPQKSSADQPITNKSPPATPSQPPIPSDETESRQA